MAQGISNIAEKTQLAREALYRSLSESGNPGLSTLLAVLNSLGLSISINESKDQAS